MKPHCCFVIQERFQSRKNSILAERTQFVSPQRRSMRETLCATVLCVRKTALQCNFGFSLVFTLWNFSPFARIDWQRITAGKTHDGIIVWLSFLFAKSLSCGSNSAARAATSSLVFLLCLFCVDKFSLRKFFGSA